MQIRDRMIIMRFLLQNKRPRAFRFWIADFGFRNKLKKNVKAILDLGFWNKLKKNVKTILDCVRDVDILSPLKLVCYVCKVK